MTAQIFKKTDLRQDRSGWVCLGDELNGDIRGSLHGVANL